MQIVDFIQDSYQEFDDLHSLVLFSKNCNFKCKDCYNLEKVTYSDPIGNAIDIIKNHITPMHESVVFLGGEPTIWGNALIESTKFAKHKMNMKVKVFSNGSNPDVIKKLILSKSVDSFSFDYKCSGNTIDVLGINIPLDQYKTSVFSCIKQSLDANIKTEVRTTCFKNIDINDIKKSLFSTFPNINHIVQKPFEFSKQLVA